MEMGGGLMWAISLFSSYNIYFSHQMLIPLFCSKEISKKCSKKTKETIRDDQPCQMYSSCIRDSEKVHSDAFLDFENRPEEKLQNQWAEKSCCVIYNWREGPWLTICSIRIGVFSGSYIKSRGEKQHPSEFWKALIQKLKLWIYNAKARITGEDPGTWKNQKFLKTTQDNGKQCI